MNLTALFKSALEVSWQGSLVILLILLLRPLLGLRVPARWRYLLWMIALIRLLVPAFLLPPSPASLQNVAAVRNPVERAEMAILRSTAARPGAVAQGPQAPVEEEMASAAPVGAAPVVAQKRSVPWWRVVAGVWVAGALGLGGFVVAATLFFHRRLRREGGPASEEVARIWKDCCARLSLRRPPRLIATALVESPALLGVFRPVLLIPRGSLESFSREDWEHVFLHELAHYSRRDHWTQALQIVVLCVHWFNPLVWIGLRCLRADRELAADEWALRHFEDQRSTAYGSTLLKVLSTPFSPRLAPGLVGIMEDAAQLKQRLRHIVAFTRRRLAGSCVGIGVALLLAAVVLGGHALDFSDYEGLNPAETLVSAAYMGDRPMVEKMLALRTDINASVPFRRERTALTAAIAGDQRDIVALLVEGGADLQRKPEKDDAPLSLALKRGRKECARYLLSRGAKCEPEKLAAARGDAAAIQALLAAGQTSFGMLQQLTEIAACNGHAELFLDLYDAARAMPGHSGWDVGYGVATVAIARGHRAVVEAMLKEGERLNKTGVMRLGPAAAQSEGMREWLEAKGYTVPEFNDGERLIEACERDNVPEIRRLLKAGTDMNYRGESDWTPISKSATWGCPRAVKILIEHGAEPNPRKHGYSTLALAKTPEIAGMLFGAGAEVKPEDVAYAVTFGTVELVKWFLDHGAAPTKESSSNRSLLAQAGNPEIARLLIESGADAASREKNTRSSLLEIAAYGKTPAATIRVLLESGADPNARDERGATALMSARDGATVDVLVEFGADLYAMTNDGVTVMNSHPHEADATRIEALLRHGLTLDGETGSFLLAWAASENQSDVVKLLLEMGVDPNASSPMMPNSEHRWTPLAALAHGNSEGIARLLIEHGADATERMPDAVMSGRSRLVRLFWESGVRNISPLCYAVTQSEGLPALERIIAAGGGADPREDIIVTPLGAAAVLGQLETVKFLVARGARPDAGKYPPLTIAADEGKYEVVAYLLDRGAKATAELLRSVVNDSNPYQTEAPVEHFTRIVKLLIEHGALTNCTAEQGANILISAAITRNPGGNPAVIKMLLDHGLSVNSRTSTSISFGTENPPAGKTQSPLEVIRIAGKANSWGVKPEVVALFENAAKQTKP